jgi:hypothetical protein
LFPETHLHMRLFFQKLSFLLFFVAVLFVVVPPQRAQACYSWFDASICAAILDNVWEEMRQNIGGAIMSAAKGMFVQIMNQNVMVMIGGGGQQGPMFITNWQQFLYAQPQQNAQAYLNDFFTLTTGGRSSSADYRSVSGLGQGGTLADNGIGRRLWLSREGVVAGISASEDSSEGVSSGNYEGYLKESAEKSVLKQPPQVNIHECASDPAAIFSQGDWRCFSSLVSNPANNKIGYSLLAQDAYSQEKGKQEWMAFAQGIAGQGYLPKTGSDGSISTPAITIRDVVDGVQDLGNKIIAGVSNPGEFLGSTITSVANQAMQVAVQVGMNTAQGALNQGLTQLQAGGVAGLGMGSLPADVSSLGSFEGSEQVCSGSDSCTSFLSSSACSSKSSACDAAASQLSRSYAEMAQLREDNRVIRANSGDVDAQTRSMIDKADTDMTQDLGRMDGALAKYGNTSHRNTKPKTKTMDEIVREGL